MTTSLLHNDGLLTPDAADLVHALLCQHGDTGAAPDGVAAAVGRLRAVGLDAPRKRLDDGARNALAARKDLLPRFEGLGLVRDVLATGTVRHIILFGARFVAIAKRIEVLRRALKAGLVPDDGCRVYLLSGHRLVDLDEKDLVRALPACPHLTCSLPWMGDPPVRSRSDPAPVQAAPS